MLPSIRNDSLLPAKQREPTQTAAISSISKQATRPCLIKRSALSTLLMLVSRSHMNRVPESVGFI